MKKIRPALLGILGLSAVLILATGCFRPAASDVTPTSSEGAEAATPEASELEATAIANSTRAAERMATQTAEAETTGQEPAETATEPAATATEPAATATSEPPTQAATVAPTTPVPTQEPAATSVPATGTTHVVQPGENLFRIALRYGTTVGAIAQANGIANTSQIYAGQELTIPSGTGAQPAQPSPGGTTYVVQPGDNLFRIALRYNLSHLRLAEYNGITNPSNIYVGQVIRIPPQ